MAGRYDNYFTVTDDIEHWTHQQGVEGLRSMHEAELRRRQRRCRPMLAGEAVQRKSQRLELAHRIGIRPEFVQAKLRADQRDSKHRIVDAQDLDECSIADGSAQLLDVEVAERSTSAAGVARTVPHSFLETQLLRAKSDVNLHHQLSSAPTPR